MLSNRHLSGKADHGIINQKIDSSTLKRGNGRGEGEETGVSETGPRQ